MPTSSESSCSQNVYSLMIMPDLSTMSYANCGDNGRSKLLKCLTLGPTV